MENRNAENTQVPSRDDSKPLAKMILDLPEQQADALTHSQRREMRALFNILIIKQNQDHIAQLIDVVSLQTGVIENLIRRVQNLEEANRVAEASDEAVDDSDTIG